MVNVGVDFVPQIYSEKLATMGYSRENQLGQERD